MLFLAHEHKVFELTPVFIRHVAVESFTARLCSLDMTELAYKVPSYVDYLFRAAWKRAEIS